jgi:predicted RNase H-like nuclease (RuvC/YqgF family)
MKKIALLRVRSDDRGDYEEWVKDHITNFTEVTDEEYEALFHFFRSRYKKGEYRFILIEDETMHLPKTIAEALEFRTKELEKEAERERRLKKQQKEREKLKEIKKLKKMEEEVEKLEEYKAKLKRLKESKSV